LILRIRFYLLLKSISFCFLLFKVFFDGFAMREVIGDGRVETDLGALAFGLWFVLGLADFGLRIVDFGMK